MWERPVRNVGWAKAQQTQEMLGGWNQTNPTAINPHQEIYVFAKLKQISVLSLGTTVHDKLFINKICIDCHPEKIKNQAAKQRRFCFVQDLTGYKSYSLIGKMLKYA